ncbi:T9SS type A sorting domain-containing protein, partial [candidate division KSB1 bacterium]|nr:T9SS type A sorting domain-containing protein [candidate division KSB1 bacterium]
GTQYVYSSWSDAGAQTHTYTVPGTNQTVTSNFTTQYYLTINSVDNHDNPQGEDWYNANASANFSVTTPADESGGTRYEFTSWSGDHTGSNASASITMNGPKTVTANWQTQHYLTVNSVDNHDDPQGEDWYDEGTSANFSVTTPADESGGSRYRFTNWSGDHSGSNASESITMNGPKTVTANWQEQHFLTTSENPDAGGDISPAPPGEWYDDGTSAPVDATENPGYVWEGWTGDLNGTTSPNNITMNAPKNVTANFGKQVQITIKTDPVGREFKVDGTTHTTTQVFTWIENSQHTIAIVTSPQAGAAGTQYVYSSWSDGGAQTHTYTVPGTNQTVKANFTTQYYLTVTSARDNPQGEGWYNAGTTANFSVTSPADEQNGTRYVFDTWSGDSNAGTASASIQMNSPKEVVAGWITQYYLTVNSDRDDPQGQGWYNAGADAEFSVTTPTDEANRTRYMFTHWDGSKNSTNASDNITMDAPKEVTAHWQTQYFLQTAENPDYGGDVDPAPPGDWYNSGTAATVTATPSGNYEWLGWSGNLSGKTNPAQIIMNAPKSVTANFGGEEVTTPGTPTGPSAGYTGQSLSYTASGAVSSFGHTVEYKFDWGDGSESSWGAATRSHTYSSKGNYSIKAKARCATDTEVISSWSDGKAVSIYTYTLTTSVSPEGAGSINRNPNKTGYDYNEVVKLTAIASSGGSLFDHWSGGLTGNQNPKNLTMNSDKNVVAHFILETVSTPDKPSGPAEEFVGQDIEFNVDGALSSFGHDIEYQLDFGNGVQSNWFESTVIYAYENSGTFQVQARARCVDHTEIISDWSDNMDITINGLTLTVNTNPEAAGYVVVNPDKNEYGHQEIVQIHAIANDDAYRFESWSGVGSHWTVNPRDVVMYRNREITANYVTETVSIPDVPTGPLQGTTEDVLTFQTGGSVSSFGHDVEYQFEWEEDSLSVWGDSLQNHTYTTHGSKQVKARARCVDHNQVVSDWSDVFIVVISDFTLSITIDPEGTGKVTKNPDKAKYAENEVVELIPEAEPFYLFDHWSGDLTGSDNPATITMDSDKDVTAHFVQTSETVSKPTFLNGPDSGIMGRALQFSTGGSSSNLGNEVEYQYNWGDDTYSEWDSGTRSHTYFVSGVMEVKSRARSKENISVVSEWSEIKPVTISGHMLTVTIDPSNSGNVEKNPNLDEYADSSIVHLKAVPDSGYGFIEWSGDVVGNNNPVTLLITESKNVTAFFEKIDETVSPPDQPVGLKNAIIGQQINFTVSGSVNSLGLEVEYQFNWGDNSLSTWNSGGASHIYFIADTFQVKARARSKEHQDILSDWSEVLPVVIVGLELTVTIEPAGSGLIAQNPNKLVYAYLDTVEMWPVGTNGYFFDYWSEDLVGENSPGRLIMNGNKNVTAHFETVLETVTSPDAPEGPPEGYRKQPLTYKAKGAVTNLGSAVEYQFDWGDGNMSSWGDSIRTYKFSDSGGFLIRCRARSKVSVTSLSDWSDTLGTAVDGCKLVITVDPENSGEIHKDPGQADYDYATIVKLTAVNHTNYKFVQWNEDPGDTAKVKFVTMNEDRALTAWFESTVSVSDIFEPIPTDFALKQNYPNPFNPETTIEYQLARDCEVQITIYNINGQQIKHLINEDQSAGNYSIIWNAKNQYGDKIPSGIYLYQIRTKFFTTVRKMLLLK